jgi:hypothetical protein
VNVSKDLTNAIPDELLKDFHREIVSGWNLQKVKAEHQAKWQAKLNHSGKARTVEGLGQMVARIPPDVFHFWEKKLGKGCWSDKGFLDYMKKYNPELFVKSSSHKTALRVDGFKGGGLCDQFGKPL